LRIYCDFDGTITTQDTTDVVLRELALPEWEPLEEAWLAGQITSAECMRRQVALIQGDDAALAAVLNRIELRSGFAAFASWCKSESLALTVVSDGVDYLIQHVLKRHGLQHLPVYANRLAGVPGARRLEQPLAVAACVAGSGVCKCRIGRTEVNQSLVYVGDGRSDFCVAEEADVLFARGTLARHCVMRGISFVGYDTFADVQRYLFLMRQDERGMASAIAG
jgi:2,3-diketo-5-methylthio-1-phosphopentane phosphatase